MVFLVFPLSACARLLGSFEDRGSVELFEDGSKKTLLLRSRSPADNLGDTAGRRKL